LHRNAEVREKANKCIKRIKGWRTQGSLQEGVTVDSNIKVSAAYQEPDMDNTLSWLDRENCDDRIVASVLAVHAEFPNSKVTLVTGDINLQNKADAAFIDVDEI
ncbi:MAG: PIN domain-containing protein, partial [Cycloclasticus sp.]|nr:PIN domain-containing protein [Cycloclasticus sp.]